MSNYLFCLFFLAVPSLFSRLSDNVEKPEVYCPPEFGPQKCLYLTWSWDSAKKGRPYYEVTKSIIKAIDCHLPIKILYNNTDSLETITSNLSQTGVSLLNLEFIPIDSSTIWIRDTGPMFVKLASGGTIIRQFRFNAWGYDDDDPNCTVDADYQLKEKLSRWLNISSYSTDMTSEGGNHECNGKGVMLLVEPVELDRNPNWSKENLEQELCQSLGLHKVIWLPFGLYEDDKTSIDMLPNEEGKPTYYTPLTPGGHVDEFCRFASADTILLAKVTEEEAKKHPISLENYNRLEAIYDILSKEITTDGRQFTIVRVPVGPLIFDEFQEGDSFFKFLKSFGFQPQKNHWWTAPYFPVVCSTSYLNYVKFNDFILISQYWTQGSSVELKERDRAVMKIFKELYPSAAIIPINVRNINIAGGGLHCMTLNQPL